MRPRLDRTMDSDSNSSPDETVPIDTTAIREEIQQLEAIARVSRSHATFEKNLQQLCIENIYKHAKILQESRNFRELCKRIAPDLRCAFLKQLESWAEENETNWTDEEFERVFSLVQLLLDESITEFDFKIYRQRIERDRETWDLLTEKCPNLTHVEDYRKRTKGFWVSKYHHVFVEMDILPDLLKLERLEHIKMQHHICTAEQIAQLLEAFPNLRMLFASFRFQHINNELLGKLFKLQKLEFLRIGLSGLFDESVRPLAKYLKNELMVECLRHLPALQHITVYDQLDESHASLNLKHQVLMRPLSLKYLRVSTGFKGWTCEMLPCVTDLTLSGPLRNVDEFLGFKNLKVLTFWGVRGSHIAGIIKMCRFQLERLSIHSGGYKEGVEVDPFIVFSCPTLRCLNWGGYVCPNGHRDLYPLSASNFLNLKEVWLLHEGDLLPSCILEQILMAPKLQKVFFNEEDLDSDQMTNLLDRLRRREILQHLEEFEMSAWLRDSQVKDELVTFLKLLPCYAPRLRVLTCPEDCYDPESLPTGVLSGLNIPGFEFKLDIF